MRRDRDAWTPIQWITFVAFYTVPGIVAMTLGGALLWLTAPVTAPLLAIALAYRHLTRERTAIP